MEAYSHRVRQLEDFILAHSLDVPAVDIQHDKTLKHLSALFGCSPEPDLLRTTATTRVPLNPAATITSPIGVDQSSSTEAVLEPTPPETIQPIGPLDLEVSPDRHEELEDANGGISAFTLDLAAQLPSSMTVDADWIWNMSTMPQLNDVLSDTFHDVFVANDIATSQDELAANRTLDLLPSETSSQKNSADDDDDRMAVTNQLSARLGTLIITDNNRSRYYGSTSNFSLVHVEHMSSSLRSTCPSEKQAQERIAAAGLDQPVDRELMDHLLSLYFTWHNPSLHVVEQDIFDGARQQYESGEADTPFFSPLLLNAM